jgi:hypothetical protein
LRGSCSSTPSGAAKPPMRAARVGLVSPAAMGGIHGTYRQRLLEAFSKT